MSMTQWQIFLLKIRLSICYRKARVYYLNGIKGGVDRCLRRYGEWSVRRYDKREWERFLRRMK